MTRFPYLPLAAVVTVLGAASVATADFVTNPVSFRCDFSGFYPGGPAESWSIEYDLEVTYDESLGSFDKGKTSFVQATFVVGGEQIMVTSGINNTFRGESYLEIGFMIPDAPFGFGPMEIAIFGPVSYEGNCGCWFAEMQAGISSGSGFFGDGETYDVDFSAEVIPAPGAIALFGLAGLSGRRRRD